MFSCTLQLQACLLEQEHVSDVELELSDAANTIQGQQEQVRLNECIVVESLHGRRGVLAGSHARL